MPLCPECIKQHTKKHIQNNEEINYETIENAIEQVQEQLQQSGTSNKADQVLHRATDSLQNMEHVIQSWAKDSDEILERVRASLYREADAFVAQLAKEVQDHVEKKRIFALSRTGGLHPAGQAHHLQTEAVHRFRALRGPAVLQGEQAQDHHADHKGRLHQGFFKYSVCQDYQQDLLSLKQLIDKEKFTIVVRDQNLAQVQRSF